MAITKGKEIRQRIVHRGGRKPGSSAAKGANQRAVKGKAYSLKLRPNATSRSVQSSKARRRGAQHPGRRSSGSWDTQKWLIGKRLAHVVKEKLIADFRKGDVRESGRKAKKQQTGR